MSGLRPENLWDLGPEGSRCGAPRPAATHTGSKSATPALSSLLDPLDLLGALLAQVPS